MHVGSSVVLCEWNPLKQKQLYSRTWQNLQTYLISPCVCVQHKTYIALLGTSSLSDWTQLFFLVYNCRSRTSSLSGGSSSGPPNICAFTLEVQHPLNWTHRWHVTSTLPIICRNLYIFYSNLVHRKCTKENIVQTI
jgi:hypothetical protein